MEPYWNLIKEIIRESDIVLEIIDARAIEISRNPEIEKMIREANRPKIIVVNKIDLADKHILEVEIEALNNEIKQAEERAEVVFVTMKQKKTVKVLLAKIRQMFSKYGKRIGFSANPLIKKPYREAKGDIVVGVIGYPNVGKSSIINALSFKKKVKVSSRAGTTHGVHWITANKEIKLIDTPGVIPLGYKEESKLAFISSRNPEKLKEPDVSAGVIIEFFIKENKLDKLENFYEVKLEERENPCLILDEIAIKKGHLRKGGIPDDNRTSIMIIRDWQRGKLKIN